MTQEEYGSLAARRFKQFKKQKRRESIKKKIVAFLYKLFRAIVIVLKKARIIRARKVENVTAH
jgi:hypothetical protein